MIAINEIRRRRFLPSKPQDETRRGPALSSPPAIHPPFTAPPTKHKANRQQQQISHRGNGRNTHLHSSVSTPSSSASSSSSSFSSFPTAATAAASSASPPAAAAWAATRAASIFFHSFWRNSAGYLPPPFFSSSVAMRDHFLVFQLSSTSALAVARRAFCGGGGSG